MTAVLVIAGVVAILDQLTKAVALDRLAPGVPVQLIDGLLALTLVKNEGLAFGLLAGLRPCGRRVGQSTPSGGAAWGGAVGPPSERWPWGCGGWRSRGRRPARGSTAGSPPRSRSCPA